MRAKKVDANQHEIVNRLRDIGASVAITSAMGFSFPDLVVGWRYRNFLFEIKTPEGRNAKSKLSEGQRVFFSAWRGQVDVITSFEDAYRIINRI